MVIVGGGIIGLCTSRLLSEAGHEVIVLDSEDEDFERCSWGNSGMIVPSHVVPLAAPGMIGYGLKMLFRANSPFGFSSPSPELGKWAAEFAKAANSVRVALAAPLLHRLHSDSLGLYVDWCEEIGVPLIRRGLSMLCLSEQALHEEIAAAENAAQLGVEYRILDRNALKELDHQVDCAAVGAVHYPGDAWLDPAEFCRAMRQSLQDKVQFQYSARCTNLEFAGSRVRSAKLQDGRRVAGDHFVLALGAWTAEAGRWLGVNLPMMSGKGYSVTLAKPPQVPSVCSLWPEFRVACTPMSSGLRFGGTMELGSPSYSISRSRVEGILDSVRKMFPRFETCDLESERVWAGNRPCTPDGLPYLGRIGKWDNVVVAAGHAMMGLSLGPISGQLVAEALDGGKQIALLDPNRYA